MNKNSIALMTDSTCDIPEELIQQYGITIIPELVIWGDQTFRDRLDISPQAFYERIEKDPVMPTTTLPTPVEFEKAYKDAIAQGAKEIVMFTVSAAMSGTFQAAKQVADRMGFPVHVVDSKGPTMSLGWQVLAAARTQEAGATVQEMIAAADKVREKLVLIVCLNTLEYLHRGGRIGTATKFLGTLLDIKPLVQINHKTGIVEPSGQARDAQEIHRGFDRAFLRAGSNHQPHPCGRHAWQCVGGGSSHRRAHSSNVRAQGIADQHHRPRAGNPYRSARAGLMRLR